MKICVKFLDNEHCFATHYFDSLYELAKETIASDRDGNGMSIDAGIEEAAAIIKERSSTGGKLFFIGNGGSAGIASHMATDFLKNGRIPAMCFSDPSLLTCITNDLGYKNSFREPLSFFASAQDILIAVSSSGQSDNILEAVEQARNDGCLVISFSGFESANPLRKSGDLNFYTPSSHYGLVENTHQSLIHCVLDYLMKGNQPPGTA